MRLKFRNQDCRLSQSEEYKSFRGTVPLKKITVAEDKTWNVFDTGVKSGDNVDSSPLLCLPPLAGAADVFFQQCLALSSRGYRVLAVQWPVYWSHERWCLGLSHLLDRLGLERVHIFGASLGGFLAQKFAEYTQNCPRVASLILCNSFTDTAIFGFDEEASSFWLLPNTFLRKLILSGLQVGVMDRKILDATEFIIERLETMHHSDLASRLTLSATSGYVQPQHVNDLPVTIIDVFDGCSLDQAVREETYKFYPNAKLAHLKSGGNFPFLSRSEEVNLHLVIHLRNFENAL